MHSPPLLSLTQNTNVNTPTKASNEGNAMNRSPSIDSKKESEFHSLFSKEIAEDEKLLEGL